MPMISGAASASRKNSSSSWRMPFLMDLVPRVVGIDPPAKEVEAEPPALVLQLRLIAHHGCAERLPEVLGLDQLCIWPDGPNCAHRENYRRALGDECAQERGLVAAMRLPVAIEPAEARGRQRLVYRREHLDPRIAPRHALCVPGEERREPRIE